MGLEVTNFRIHPGQQAEFGAALAHGVATVLPTSPGFISARVERSIEPPALTGCGRPVADVRSGPRANVEQGQVARAPG